ALLLPQIFPIFSVIAPCRPDAARRDLRKKSWLRGTSRMQVLHQVPHRAARERSTRERAPAAPPLPGAPLLAARTLSPRAPASAPTPARPSRLPRLLRPPIRRRRRARPRLPQRGLRAEARR